MSQSNNSGDNTVLCVLIGYIFGLAVGSWIFGQRRPQPRFRERVLVVHVNGGEPKPTPAEAVTDAD